jgi:hypothetical protein
MKTKIPKEGEMKSEWTDKDVNYLVKHHDTQTADQMARHLKKTYDQVKAKLRRMGLKSLDDSMTNKNKKWSEFIENNKDEKTSKEIRLNKVTLLPNKNGMAEIIFFGDLHLGYPTCDKKKAQAMLDWALANKCYVIGMGDYMECGITGSVGDVYQQTLNPQKQMDEVTEMFRPLAEAGLLIGLHTGNHEARIYKGTSIDPVSIMCKILGVPYLGYSCWTLISVGSQHYSMYSTHGAGGSRFKHTKLKAVMDLVAWIQADIVAMGHVHTIVTEEIRQQHIDLRSRCVVETKCYVIETGAYMLWDGSYGQTANMPITTTGSPKIKLSGEKKDFHCGL